MKRLTYFLLIILLVLGLTSCGKSKLEQSNERLAETYSHILDGAKEWEEKIQDDDEKDDYNHQSQESQQTEENRSWTEYAQMYFPDAKVEEDGFTAIITVSIGNEDPDQFMSKCLSVLSHLDGCEIGTMVTINISDDPGASIVGIPNENGLFGFESTAILTEGSQLQESYNELFIGNDRDHLE
jgi:hypothetical protein